jgi:hypothetical protein
MSTPTPPKPSKSKYPDTQTFQVEGHRIVLTKLPMEYRDFEWNGRTEKIKKFRVKYAVEVDGVLRLHFIYPQGGSPEWFAQALEGSYYGSSNFARKVYAPREWVLDRPVTLAPEVMVQMIPEWLKEGQIPSADEIAAETAEREAQEARREQEAKATRKRWRAEDQAKKAAEQRQRDETLEALEGLRKRLGDQLTNLEHDVVARLIEGVRAEDARAKAHAEAIPEREEED